MKHTATEIQLKNGAKGLFLDFPDAPVMTYEFNFRAGEYLVEKDKWEAPHLMEHVLLGANKLIPKARTFQAEFEKNGAYNNASTSVYHITYESECADFEWQRILGLMLTAISKPLFLKEEFDAEFGNVRDELTARANNHFRRLSLTMQQRYGLLSMTDAQRLKLMNNVSLSDVQKHYKNTHTTNNMRFVIAGNLRGRKTELKKMIEAIELPEGDSRLALPTEKPQQLDEPVFIANKSVKNIYFYLDTFAKRRFQTPDRVALGLINTMLTETLYSRILGEARERGLLYSMGSGLQFAQDYSGWWFGAQIIPTNAPKLFDIILHELQRVRIGDIAEADLDAAKQYLLGRYQREGQTVGSIANFYAGKYYYEDTYENYYNVPRLIKAVTTDRIVDCANTMFAENIGGLGVLGGSDEQIAKSLRQQIASLWS